MSVDSNGRSQIVIPVRQLYRFIVRILGAMGVPAADSKVIADGLIWADLRGRGPQGVAKLPLIASRVAAGGIPTNPKPRVIGRRGSTIYVEGDDAWGHVAGTFAMRLAIEAASNRGLGVAVVRNTQSGSAMGYYASLASRSGMLGLAVNNNHAVQAASGHFKPVLGNQAFAISSPRVSAQPLVFDTATTTWSLTRLQILEDEGHALPADAALDAQGRPARSFDEARMGSLLSAGGHWGFGLALMWELITGALSGSDNVADEITVLGQLDRPQRTAHLMVAIDPSHLMPRDQFAHRVETVLDRIEAASSPTLAGRARLPGEASEAKAKRRLREGVPLDTRTLRALKALAEGNGVRLEWSLD